MNVPTVTLNDGQTMPQLGFGVWQVSGEEIIPAIQTAIEAGYRSIDTAAAYGNQPGVGEAIRTSGVPREEIFLTTKLWSDKHADAMAGVDESLAQMGMDYLDLYLIHWPRPKQGHYRQAWKGLVELQKAGRSRSIGVSNFTVQHLTEIMEDTGVVPAVNQIELHPNFQQKELRAFHDQHGIRTESWSPLGQGGELLKNPVLAEIAAKYGKTPAQVVLRWHLDLDFIVIPKSVTPARIRENLDVFDFKLDADDMDKIEGLETGTRLGGDPDTADW